MSKGGYSNAGGSNETIMQAIQRISRKGILNSNGNLAGSEKIYGFVVKVHTEGAFTGTVDVMEYDSDNCLHENVRLSAIQDNSKGFVIIPKLKSDVVIVKDPDTHYEYVIMYSCVDHIQLDSFETVSVGVKEREPFNEDDDVEVENLKPTGVYSNTTYGKNTVVTVVQGDKKENRVEQKVTDITITDTVGTGENACTSSMTQTGIDLKHKTSSVSLKEKEVAMATGKSKVKVTDGVVFVGGEEADSGYAVLGEELADILSDILTALGNSKVLTQIGTNPLINFADFIKLKSKINKFKASHTGFITKKVRIQK